MWHKNRNFRELCIEQKLQPGINTNMYFKENDNLKINHNYKCLIEL